MSDTQLRAVADSVVRRAQRQGYVVPRDVRDELNRAGLPDKLWKDVLSLAHEALQFRQGRYYCVQTTSPRLHEQQRQQRKVLRSVRELIRHHEPAQQDGERRQQDRIDFLHPATVQPEDGRVHHVLTRDLSPTGIRLLGSRSLLGQKLTVHLPETNGSPSYTFLVRILWTCTVGDDLFENGGALLGVAGEPEL
jgi:hypothetical protein